jgi:two-component system phosphate regulon response regulator PhoB/two-component system alkaline phosphatase synthesis response regulator PhoP
MGTRGGVDVLFIEDDPALAAMYQLKLKLDGYHVRVSRSGEEGLTMVEQRRPDLIFLDIGLPRMDGFAVLEQLRADRLTQSIPVVILTNYGEREQIERSRKLGALDFLIKASTTPSRLSNRMTDWLK